ncbi:hypothetical protein E2562_000492 [Oryza meyeriana var. granulata]|uniref:Uncharacterized protein n=1 Tax=Oryza meyeriana var. granulata TaxID=110450 RepID=A0A6G1CC92_9ORYZ|nr:hypothetical protein E2562_000492 [Oryza meyeriana var. granulata]
MLLLLMASPAPQTAHADPDGGIDDIDEALDSFSAATSSTFSAMRPRRRRIPTDLSDSAAAK